MSRLMNRKGQGLVEYILLIVVMAILAISAVQRLATSTKNGFTKASSNLDDAFQG